MRARLDRWPFNKALWLFPIAVTFHMLEECLWLPRWSQQAGAWHEPVSAAEFSIAAGILVVFVFGLTLASSRGGTGGLANDVLLGLALVMLINVIYPHLGATISLRTYAPGLATALLLNLPVMLYLLNRAFREQVVTKKRFAGTAALVLPAAAIIWPALFRLGRGVADVLG